VINAFTLRAKRFCAAVLLIVITAAPVAAAAEVPDTAHTPLPAAPFVRFEVLPVDNGAELITLFFTDTPRPDAIDRQEVPLISVLRDTLGSTDSEIHRLRYVWVHSSGSPGLKQRIVAATPFIYGKVGNAGIPNGKKPSPVMDLSAQEDRLWKSLWEFALKGALIDPRLSLVESAFQRYQGNRSAYIQSQLARAATAIDMDNSDFPALTDAERRQLQQRFAQRNSDLAPLLSESQLERFYKKEMIAMRQACARNWELLRQRAEAEGLYFEPLSLPDGTATHVLLWVAREEVMEQRSRDFDDRFLSIGKPWGDKKLVDWRGPTEIRWVDKDHRRVSEGTPDARRVELIPLALYGLDHPKIPPLLVDFRKPFNAKARELSRHAADVIGGRLSSGPGATSFLVKWGRTAGGFVARKVGLDLFQPSRLQSYSQLKMVLATNPGITPEMRSEIARRIESLGPNPFENDLGTEMELAASHYRALIVYAREPNGLQQDLERDRRAELRVSAHGGAARFMFRLGSILTFARYTHREDRRPDNDSILEAQRRNLNSKRYLEAVLDAGPHIDVYWAPQKVQTALREAAESRALPDERIASAAAQIFANSHDESTRLLCVAVLKHENTPQARSQLARLGADPSLDPEAQRILAADSAALAGTATEKPWAGSRHGEDND
jgi:hypothetical protein